MRHVKGSMFLKVAKVIKVDKSGVYDNLLTDEDKDLLSTTILTASWYPWESYKRCFNALAEVFAQGDMEVVRQWGHTEGEQLTQSAYKSILTGKDYKIAFKKIKLFWKFQFDFGELDLSFISDSTMQVVLKDFDPDFKVFFNLARGWFEQVLKMSDCKDVTSEFLVKSWEGAGDTTIQLSWA